MTEFARGGIIKLPEGVDSSAPIVPVDCGPVLRRSDLEAFGGQWLTKLRERLATCGDACAPPPP